jgi:hypothetical protein
LGNLNLENFARALHLRCPLLEWRDPKRLWVGMGNPCNEVDMSPFCAATTITIGIGNYAPFWDYPWLNGMSPKVITPLIYEVSKRKKWSV